MPTIRRFELVPLDRVRPSGRPRFLFRRRAASAATLLLLLFASALMGAYAEEPAADPSRPLIEVINKHRAEKGLPAIPASPSLIQVAQAHVLDLEASNPGGSCNMHSWSTDGAWSACCYTRDHAQARCMWDKPREISGGVYDGAGYEISAKFSGRITADSALGIWKNSVPHYSVITNQGMWAHAEWKAIGAAVSEHYAVVWFGKKPDPAAAP